MNKDIIAHRSEDITYFVEAIIDDFEGGANVLHTDTHTYTRTDPPTNRVS
jgi:hypothetical protein